MTTTLAPDVFRMLADPTRRSIFERLAREGELTVSALVGAARVSQPAVSQHLKALRGAGLVREERRGRQVFYKAKPKGLRPLVDWMSVQTELWRTSFDRLEALLDEMED
ncbi:MAG: metalloregulator ArsR/SmtB family transcription factor [Alphaproteobacteria bacterium]|nr:metalloregulator ArsR/SmtB family transcription factor [Alphaproteobacteria bacterium]